MTIKTLKDMAQEFSQQASAAHLKIDCLMDGPVNAQIVLVGEAPGVREQQVKMPFVGGSGSLLWDAMKKIGYGRTDVYCTNVIKRQVSLSTKGDDKAHVNKHELDQWISLLEWELRSLPNVKYVVILGGLGLQALKGLTGITKWRGSVLEGSGDDLIGKTGIKYVVCNNPAAALREPKLETVFRFDIGKVGRVLQGKHRPRDHGYYINPTYNEAVEYIRHVMDKGENDGVLVGGDIELISNYTACIGIGTSDGEAMCIPFRTIEENVYSLTEELRIRELLQTLFTHPRVKRVWQNGMFDASWLWHQDKLKVGPSYMDTMLAHHTLYPQLPHGLGFLVSQYTDHPYHKQEGKDWKKTGNLDEYWIYNCKDVCTMLECAETMVKELKQQKLDEFFFGHVMRLQPHLVKMTVAGMLCDIELKHNVADQLKEEIVELQNQFWDSVHTATGDDEYNPSPNSPVQLAELFFKRLGLVGRGTSTNEENRKRMASHPKTTPEAKAMLDVLAKYKGEHKFLSTYAMMRVDTDHRLRAEWKQSGTTSAPGRLSSAKTSWGTGMNMQNQPERSHPMFLADEGWEIGYFDLAQAEARYVGWDAGIDKWKEDFERARLNPGSFDCHRSLAADMFNIPYDEVPEYDRDESGAVTLRFVAKRCRHGLNYRMQSDRLAATTGLSTTRAAEAFRLYHRANPELRKWWQAIEQQVRDTHMLFNAYGRRFIIMERITEKSLESTVAFKPQSSIGDKINRVIYMSQEDDAWPLHCHIKLNIHDALVFVAPKDKMMTCMDITRRYAEEPMIVGGEEMIIPADFKRSIADEHGQHRWSNLKTVEF